MERPCQVLYHVWLIESYVGFHCLLVPILHMSAGISQSGG